MDTDSHVVPRVSVLVANFNGRDVIEACLQSVRAQHGEHDVEVIVYDDASTDDSAALVEHRFPDVRLIRGAENVGFAAANNRMAQAARGEFLLLLNNDAFLGEGALEALLERAANAPRTILSLCQRNAKTGELVDRGMGLDFLCVPFPILAEQSRRRVTVIGACLWVPRAFFLEIGGFPEVFESIAEDLFLCLLARLRGIPVDVVTTTCYYHHGGHSFGGGRSDGPATTSLRRRWLSERNRLWIMLSFCPWPLLAPMVALWGASWVLEASLLAVTQRSLQPARAIYLRALRDTLRTRDEILQLRARVQDARSVPWRHFLAPIRLWPAKLDFLLRRGVPRLDG